MNIAIITTEPAADYGGLGRHTSELSKKLISKGCNITCINIGKRNNRKKPMNSFAINRFLSNLKPLPPDIEKYDIILVQGHWAGIYLYRLKKKFNKKIIVTFHSFEGDRPERKKALGRISYFLSTLLEHHSVNSADHIFTVSEYMKERLNHFYPEKHRDTTVIFNGVDSRFINYRPSLKKEKQILSIAVIGRFEPEKGLIDFVDELEYIAEKGIDFRCTFLGKNRKEYNYYFDHLYRRIKHSNPLRGNVKFLPFTKDHSKLAAFMNEQDFIIMPSIYEPFGLIALEAMAVGTPIIAREVGGLTEFIENNVNGFMYQTKDQLFEHIFTCINNRDLHQKIISNGKSTARNYSWDKVSNKVHSRLKITGDS